MTDPVVIGRRALLGASLVAPVAIARASTLGATPNLNPGLDDLQAKIATHKRLMADWQAYYDAVFSPMEDAKFDGMQALPHVRGTLTYVCSINPEAVYSTHDWEVASARRAIREAHYYRADQLAAAHEIIALAEDREAKVAALRKRVNVEAIKQRESDLSDRYIAAADEVVTHPSTTPAELLAKLAFILKEEWWEMGRTEDGVRADVARLAGETVQ